MLEAVEAIFLRMKRLKKLRQIPEALLVGLAFVVFPFMPRRVFLAVSNGLGRLAMRCGGRMLRVAMANLDVAYGETLPRRRKEEIVRESYQVFARLVLDFFWFGVFTRRRVAAWVRFDASFAELFKRGPAIFATAHFGNWEVMGLSAALRGHPCVVVAAPFENAVVDGMLRRFRGSTGQGVAYQKGAVASLLGVLREGRIVALLVDQNTLPGEGGAFVRYFGVPVPMSRAAGALARRTGAPLLLAYCLAEKDGSYTVYTRSLRLPEGVAPGVDAWTQAIADGLEQVVRAHPGQWLWMYKRWKFIPADASPERYPYYARRADR